jgi:transposase
VLVRGGAAHAEIARNEGTSRYQVDRAFRAGAAGALSASQRALPTRISLDEAHHRRGHELATIVCDIDRRRVIEVVDGRSRRTIERYLRSLRDDERNAVGVVSIDPYEAYRLAVGSVLPHAVIVCDPFHLVRGANTALDTVRRERQRVAGSERGKGARRAGRTIWKRELYQARRALLKGRERLSFRERQRLCERFEREPLIAEAWALKETFRAIYRSRDRTQAEQRLERFLTGCRVAALPSFDAFAEGIRLWRQELLAYFDQPVTNGYAEGVINKIKLIKRRAYGLPTFEGFRRRILVACA